MGMTIARLVRLASYGFANNGSGVAILMRPEEVVQRLSLVIGR
jgi:hypothetical protein